MTLSLSESFLALAPEFRRGVVVATGASNHEVHTEIDQMLAVEWARAARDRSRRDSSYVRAWDDLYRRFGANPERDTPSIRFLLEAAAAGRPVRVINPLVAIFNIVSLRYLLPCGGDDLGAIEDGDLRVDLARGDETFASLAKPHRQDPPAVGEVVYMTVPTRRVLCRRLNWRNADFSKLTADSRTVAINLDALGPGASAAYLSEATADLAALVRRYCRCDVSIHVLDQASPIADIQR